MSRPAYDPTNVGHVHRSMQPYLAIEGRERVGKCWEHIWVPTASAKSAHIALSDCLNAGNDTKPRGLVIVGEADTGKSRTLQAFRAAHPPETLVDAEYSSHPVVLIDAPTKVSRSALLHDILADLGEPLTYKADEESLRRGTIRALRRSQVKLVMIDEFHDITHGRLNADIVSFLSFVKSLVNGVGRPFVVAGVPRVLDILRSDPQIAGRFGDVVTLKRFSFHEFVATILLFELMLPLRLPSNLRSNEDLLRYIFARSEGYIGVLSNLLQDGCRIAIESGVERITMEVLKIVPDTAIRAVGRHHV